MSVTVKHTKVSLIADSEDTGLVRPSDWNADHTLEGLGTMAEQDADGVAITGGAIDGTGIGQTSPADGKFNELEATGDVDAGGDVAAQGNIEADGDIETKEGQFKGDAGGLTGSAPNLTAGTAETVKGLVYNDTATDIPAGSVVYLKPNEVHVSVELANAAEYDKSQVFGITLNLIPKSGGSGYVCAYGYLEGIDTSAYSYGQLLYLDPNNDGSFTDEKPVSPDYIVTVANVWEVGVTGVLFVNPNNASIDDDFFIGLLKIIHGGTNSSATPTAGAVPYGDGTKYMFTDAGTAGQVLSSNGEDAPTWVDAGDVSVSRWSGGETGLTPDTLTGGDVTVGGVLKTSSGGTGLDSYQVGDMTYWSTGTALTTLEIGTANQMLISTGTAPSWDDVSNQAVTSLSGGTTGLSALNSGGGSKGALILSGSLSPANGGTGATSAPISGGVAYGTPDGTLNTTPAGSAGQILQSDGSGTPTWVDSSSITELTIVNDTETNTLFYPTFTDATTGTVSQLEVSSPKYTYNPSLGEIQSTDYRGDFVEFRVTPTAPVTSDVGRMTWNDDDGTADLGLKGGNVVLQVGQENVCLVYNNSGSTITAGQVVAVNGAQGQRPAVVLADADSEELSAPTLGIATEDIAAEAEGFITTFGIVRGIDTSGFTAGSAIYLSQTLGEFTATRPLAPAHTVALGWVIKVNASSGEVFVNINNGWEIEELHNVRTTSVTGGNLLAYDETAGYWKNINLTDGTAISITEATDGAVTITNTGVTSWSAGTTGFTPSTATTGAVTLAGTLGTANGGTNNTETPAAGTVATGDGTKIAYTAAGTSGQVLKSNGTSTPTWVDPSTLGANISITDDTTTNSAFYPTFTSATSGTITGETVSSTKFSYNPSLGSITTYGDAFFNGMRVGHGAANVLTNSVVGADSLDLATTGANNTAFGYQALKNVTTGSNLTAFGYQAGYSTQDASEFTAFGYLAAYANTTGHGLSAFGYAAGAASTTGWYNSYIGGHAGQNNVGEYNTAVGGRALFYATTGNYNTIVGADAALQKASGSSNTGLGYRVLDNTGTGSGNVAIGAYAGLYETSSNAFYLNNQDRTNTAGDKAGSLMYGTFNATPSSQTLAINAATTVSNSLTTQSLVVNNNSTLGSSNTDTLDVRARIISDLEPNSNNAKDIGTNGRNWRDGFFGRTLSTVNLEVTGTTSFDGSQGTAGQVLTSAGTGNTPTWSALPATGVTIADDTTTNSSLYPVFTTVTSGSVTTQYVSSTKYNYNPSVGTLSAPQVAATNGIVVNSNTVSASYSIPSGSNGMSAGPLSVATGITVTVPTGSTWVIV